MSTKLTTLTKALYRSHALRGNAAPDALRSVWQRGALLNEFPRRAWELFPVVFTLSLVPKHPLGNSVTEALASRDGKLELPKPNFIAA
jgi:hypothetical protein